MSQKRKITKIRGFRPPMDETTDPRHDEPKKENLTAKLNLTFPQLLNELQLKSK